MLVVLAFILGHMYGKARDFVQDAIVLNVAAITCVRVVLFASLFLSGSFGIQRVGQVNR